MAIKCVVNGVFVRQKVAQGYHFVVGDIFSFSFFEAPQQKCLYLSSLKPNLSVLHTPNFCKEYSVLRQRAVGAM